MEVAVTAATGTMEGAATVALVDMGTGAMDAQAMLLARAGMFCLCSDFLYFFFSLYKVLSLHL